MSAGGAPHAAEFMHFKTCQAQDRNSMKSVMRLCSTLCQDFDSTVRTQIEEKCARTLELPLLVRCLLYSFCFVLAGAEFAVFSPRVAEKGNSNVLAHFSSISVFTV